MKIFARKHNYAKKRREKNYEQTNKEKVKHRIFETRKEADQFADSSMLCFCSVSLKSIASDTTFNPLKILQIFAAMRLVTTIKVWFFL